MNGTTDNTKATGADVTDEKPKPAEEFLTKEELRTRLKVTERTIERWQHDGLLPYLKIGTVILFDWPEVVAHLRANFRVGGNGSVRPSANAGRAE